MTGLEIILAISLGLYVVFTVLVGIGAAVEQGDFARKTGVAENAARSAQATARMWRQEMDKAVTREHGLDLKIGKAVCRIISAHSEECRLRIEQKGEPSHYYGALHDHIARGLGKALNILEVETGRYKEEPADRVGPPAHGPVTAPCIVCGHSACTYRWGQCTSTWSSVSNIRLTGATTRWQDFDSRFDVTWLPLCSVHATFLDERGKVTHQSEGYHRW